MKNIAKKSAASRKAWRTRKLMRAAREYQKDRYHIETPIIELYSDSLKRYQRALPNPWLQ